MFRMVNIDGEKKHLQNYLDKLVKWSEKELVFCRGRSRLVCRGVSVSRSHMSFNLRTGGGDDMHVSFYLQKG